MCALLCQPEITVKPRSYRMHVSQLENLQGKIIQGAEYSLWK